MAITPSKENILKNIRQALSNPVPLPFPESEGTDTVFKSAKEDEAIIFAEEFTKLQGKFAFCADEADFFTQLHTLIKERNWVNIYCSEEKFLPYLTRAEITPYSNLATCDVSITGCEYLIARTGTMVLSAAQQSGRTGSVYAPVHICVAYSSQMLYDIKDALIFLKEKYNNNFPSFVSFASGSSRTADIEKTLVTGVHGPKEVYCFLIEA